MTADLRWRAQLTTLRAILPAIESWLLPPSHWQDVAFAMDQVSVALPAHDDALLEQAVAILEAAAPRRLLAAEPGREPADDRLRLRIQQVFTTSVLGEQDDDEHDN